MKRVIRITVTVLAALAVFLLVAPQIVHYNSLQIVRERGETVTEPVENIVITAKKADVFIKPSEDGLVHVYIKERGDEPVLVSAENGTLTVTTESGSLQTEQLLFAPVLGENSAGNWLDRLFRYPTHEPLYISVRLPGDAYGQLRASLTGCGLEIETPQTFASADLTVTNGHLWISYADIGSLTGRTEYGDIRTVRVTAGSASLTAEGGGIIAGIQAREELDLLALGGDILPEDCDAPVIRMTAGGGDVRGTLHSGKRFTVTAGKGTVSCPPDAEDGFCAVAVTDGSVELKLK